MSVVSIISAPEAPTPAVSPDEIIPLPIGATVGEVERDLVLHALARCDGNRTRTARVLGISVRTLRNKIREYSASGIDVPPHSDQPEARSQYPLGVPQERTLARGRGLSGPLPKT